MELDVASVNLALNNKKTVMLSCRCTVRYSGRAESLLGEGDRVILIKADKTLLIHQPTGSAPVNYMKEGATHRLTRTGNHYALHSSNVALKEYLDVVILRVHSYTASELEDDEKIRLVGSEKDMADMIYLNPGLISSDFRPLSREEHTKYGFIDVFGYDGENNLVIVECKRYVADFSAVDQLLRYVKKMKQLRGIANVKGVIAAPKISPNALAMLHDHGCVFRAVSPPNHFERYGRQQKTLGAF